MSDYDVTRTAAKKISDRIKKALRNLEDNCEDEIVVASLMESYETNRHFEKVDHADEWLEPDYALSTAIESVLEYYMSTQDFNEWVLNRDYPKRFMVKEKLDAE